MPDQDVTLKLRLDPSEFDRQIQAAQEVLNRLQSSAGAAGGGGSVGVGGGSGTSDMGGYAPAPAARASAASGGSAGPVLMATDPNTGEKVPVQLGGGGRNGALSAVPVGTSDMGGSGAASSYDAEMHAARIYGIGVDADLQRANDATRRYNQDLISRTRAQNDDILSQIDAMEAGLDGGGARGNGIMGLAGLYYAASAVQGTANTLIQNAETGRATRWYDFAGTGGMAAGATIGSIFPGVGTLAGAIVGGTIGSISQSTYGVLEDRDQARGALLSRVSNPDVLESVVGHKNDWRTLWGLAGFGGNKYLSAKDIQSEMTLGDQMALGLGEAGYTTAAYLHKRIRDATTGPGAQDIADAESKALAGTLTAEESRLMQTQGFNWASAVDIAGRGGANAAMGYLKATGVTDVTAGDLLGRAGNLSVLEQNVRYLSMLPQEQSAYTRIAAAQGGTAEDLSRSTAVEVRLLEQSASSIRNYIREMEALGSTLESDKIKIEGYRIALSETNAAIAEAKNQDAMRLVAQRMDIAGVGAAQAGTALHIGLATAGYGADGSIYDASLSAVGSQIAAARAGLDNPDLTPSQRRALQTQLAGFEASQFDMTRQKALFGVQFPAELAAASAERSGILGQGYLLGAGTGAEAGGILSRMAAATQGSADAAFGVLGMMRNNPGLFGALDMESQRNRAEAIQLQAAMGRIRSAAPGMGPGESAGLGSLGVGALEAIRDGDSVTALRAMNAQGSTLEDYLGSLSGTLAAALATARSPGEARAMRWASQEEATRTRQQLAGLAAARAGVGLSADVGIGLDAASFEFQRLFSSPFERGNRLDAGRGLYEALEGAENDARARLAEGNLDAAGRRQLLSEIQGYELQQVRLRETMNTGWMSRIMDRQMFAPDRSALWEMSNRDYLDFNPEGARPFGRAVRGANTGTFDAGVGPTSAVRPGDENAKIGTLTIKIEGLEAAGLRYQVRNDPNSKLKFEKAAG